MTGFSAVILPYIEARMVSHEGISLALQEDSCGIQQEGLGLEIQGHKHVTSHPDCCTVYLDNDTTYKIRIYNTNRFSAMVTLTLDGVAIGKSLIDFL